MIPITSRPVELTIDETEGRDKLLTTAHLAPVPVAA
jgi:hypothetical protein